MNKIANLSNVNVKLHKRHQYMHWDLGNYSCPKYSVLTHSVADNKGLPPPSEYGQDSVRYGLKWNYNPVFTP